MGPILARRDEDIISWRRTGLMRRRDGIVSKESCCRNIAENSSSTCPLNLSGSISVRRSGYQIRRIRCPSPLPHRTINTSDPRHTFGTESIYPHGCHCLPLLAGLSSVLPSQASLVARHISSTFSSILLHNLRQVRNPKDSVRVHVQAMLSASRALSP